MVTVMEGVMSDSSGVSAAGTHGTAPAKDGIIKTHPVMTAIIVIALIVALLALVVMFIFISHQSKLQDNAQVPAIEQQEEQEKSMTDTTGSIGPINVIDTELFNRENGALGQKGTGPKSSITGAELSIPESTSTSSVGF